MAKTTKPTVPPRQRAFLVGVDDRSDSTHLLGLNDSLAELELLAETAGLIVVGQSTQVVDHPNPVTYIGTGKVEEVKALVEENLADVVLFDNELSPRHLRELERRLVEKVQIIDRTALILDIFAQHANTREGHLQVELAQYEYRLPRLTRAWTHLARQAGGGGGRTGSTGGVGLRGPGETQLEVDRREIRRRISTVKEELEKVRAHRNRYRAQRKRTRMPVIALVGYTNAGKSTLINRLSHADVYVADQLFATLDPTTRRVDLPGGHEVLFTDTVGFIQKLPTQLIAAFRATLEEITEADLLIHVIDVTHPNAKAQSKAVEQTLEEIGAGKIPVITALNKIDRLQDPESARSSLSEFADSVAISGLTGLGMDDLVREIETQLFETYLPVKLKLPYQQGQLISLFHEQGQVTFIEHGRGGVRMDGMIPGRLYTRFQPFIIQQKKPPSLQTPEEIEKDLDDRENF
jgi:GTP-binding protein HflX